MPALGARGEATLETSAGEMRLLYTNRALMQAETQMGKSVLGVAEGFTNGVSGITDVAQLLRVGMEAARRDAREGGRSVTLNDAIAVLEELGFTTVAATVMTAVAAVLSYDNSEDQDPDADPNV